MFSLVLSTLALLIADSRLLYLNLRPFFFVRIDETNDVNADMYLKKKVAREVHNLYVGTRRMLIRYDCTPACDKNPLYAR